MKSLVIQFLQKFYDRSRPILLAFSGGPDSLVLLHILLELKGEFDLKLGIAHVDHRWRESSTAEAQVLQSMADKLGLPFYLKTLDPHSLSGNLEASCRQERLYFFKELSLQYGYQAVLLAHHADDQAETVLKKIFEATSLPYLAGLRQDTYIDGLRIWRPLLRVKKKEILDWIEQHSLQPIEDRTNHDPAFLRGKFRTRILPALSTEFGKEISPALVRIAVEAQELGYYLDERISPYLQKIVSGPFGHLLDLQESAPSSRFECRYLLHKFCEISEVMLTYPILESVVDMIATGAANKQFSTGNGTVFVDRRRLFALKRMLMFGQEKIALALGRHRHGIWTIEVEEGARSQESGARSQESRLAKPTDWQSAWKGSIQVILPEGNYTLGKSDSNVCYPRTSPISEWWTNEKTPAFFRGMLPVIWEDGAIAHEFLTGRRRKAKGEGRKDAEGKFLSISLTIDPL